MGQCIFYLGNNDDHRHKPCDVCLPCIRNRWNEGSLKIFARMDVETADLQYDRQRERKKDFKWHHQADHFDKTKLCGFSVCIRSEIILCENHR